ncbi:MAG: hypothetical protein WDZ59_03925 [Pirellulales bacterium]
MQSDSKYPENPYRGSQAGPDRDDYIAPNYTAAKVLGTLNIVFACVLLLCIGCYAIQIFSQAAMAPLMNEQFAEMNAQIERDRARRIEGFREQEESAETPEEAERIRQQREQFERMPTPDFSKMMEMWQIKDPRVLGFFATEAGGGALLNVLMLVSGIGLVTLRPWGRTLAVWIAGLKVARLILSCMFVIFIVAPLMAESFGDMIVEMMPADEVAEHELNAMVRVYTWMISGSWIFIAVLGSVYPLVLLAMLNRRDVKAAVTEDGYQQTFSPD